MPFVRLSLRRGHPAPYLRALSDGVHRALVETFGVPEDDRFHVIDQHAPEEFVYDPGYPGVHRTEDFLLVTVTAGRPRDTPTKDRFYRRLAELLAASPGVRPDDVMVVIQTTQADGWSFGRGVRHTAPAPEGA